MSKFARNLRTQPQKGVGVVTSESLPSGVTYEGGDGFARSTKGELYLLAVSNFVGEDTFYEDAKGRDTRFRDLVRAVAAEDPNWVAAFLKWLRTEANMRSASIVGAIEYGRVTGHVGFRWPFVEEARATGVSIRPRRVLDSVLVRADEPGEALAYWLGTYGKPIPQWLKRGIGDAALRLYSERNVLKWDSHRSALRFADVIELSRIDRAKAEGRSMLFKYLLDERRGRGEITDSLPTLAAREGAMKQLAADRDSAISYMSAPSGVGRALWNHAAMTWEALSSSGPMDARAWELVIPEMGYMALLRNLRNFDQAGISRKSRDLVAKKLADPDEVAKSRQLPMRFLSAYNAVENDFWKPVLDDAVELSLQSVPVLKGRTLVLIDTSGSMGGGFSKDGTLHLWEAAALFGVALARNADSADVVSYSGGGWYGNKSYDSKVFPLKSGENVLKTLDRFRKSYFIGGGTDTPGAVKKHYSSHDRVVLLTDEQTTGRGVFSPVPANVPTYTMNLVGYKYGHAESGVKNRYVVGGLSDACFKMISLLEGLRNGKQQWPWQVSN